jgi:hypothetical protein
VFQSNQPRITYYHALSADLSLYDCALDEPPLESSQQQQYEKSCINKQDLLYKESQHYTFSHHHPSILPPTDTYHLNSTNGFDMSFPQPSYEEDDFGRDYFPMPDESNLYDWSEASSSSPISPVSFPAANETIDNSMSTIARPCSVTPATASATAAIPASLIYSVSTTTTHPSMRRHGSMPFIAGMNAFSYYCFSNMQEVLYQYPQADVSQITEILEKKWSLLSLNERSPYEAVAAEDADGYKDDQCDSPKVENDMAESAAVNYPRKKPRKPQGAPKHPMSAYLFFVTEHRQRLRAQCPHMGFIEIAKVLGQQWREFTDEQKQIYNDRAVADKERYQKEKSTFIEEMNPEVSHESSPRFSARTLNSPTGTYSGSFWGDAKTMSTKASSPRSIKQEAIDITSTTDNNYNAPAKKKKNPLAPRNPLSAYLFFVATNRAQVNAQHPNLSFSAVARILGEKWKHLRNEDKKEYEVMSFVDKKRYEEEMRQWKIINSRRKKAERVKKTSKSTSKTKVTAASAQPNYAAQDVSIRNAVAIPVHKKPNKRSYDQFSESTRTSFIPGHEFVPNNMVQALKVEV